MTKDNITLGIVQFCARECKLQMSGELSVGWMVEAWVYAQNAPQIKLNNGIISKEWPTVKDVLEVGRLVEPWDNRDGFRTAGVRIGQDVKMDWKVIPRQIENLIKYGFTLPPAEFFKEYEEIHPFIDGNGRSGAILFNWINGTLDNPVWPPNFWNDPRRTIGNGA